MNVAWCCMSMPWSWCRGRQRMSGGCWTGSEMNRRRGQGKEGERRQKGKEERPYHDNSLLVLGERLRRRLLLNLLPRPLLIQQAQSDRKSTRLNSSHQIISYAVFCLKKKTLIVTS